MDNYSPDAFVNRDEPIPTIVLNTSTPRSQTPSTPASTPQQQTGHESEHSDAETPSRRRGGLRGRFSAFREKARIQDQLVEKLLQQVVPLDDAEFPQDDPAQKGGSPGSRTQRPNFNLTTMSNNFRRFNSRIGVVFVFQARALRLLSWKQPTHTLSFLAIYTFVCLDPYLIPLLPLAILLIAVLIPSFVARHPATEFSLGSEQAIGYSPHGPPLAPAVTVKPVRELSHDFFRNMRDLQNCMEDFSQLHDGVIKLIVPMTNFSDEATSSALFVALFGVCLFMSIASNILPWRLIFLVLGWGVTACGHPAVQQQIENAHRKHVVPQEEKAATLAQTWIKGDVILDSPPETREVEIFELQRLSNAGEWEPWLFSASPYDPLSPGRIAGDRPTGTRFFEDVLPPQGWQWSEKKWALDLWSREWVEERIITGVEIETEGERWVYDIYDEQADRVGIAETYTPSKGKEKGGIGTPKPSWEEGEDGEGRRGDWRRRRWVRLVKRRNVSPGAAA
ncbi:integral peroxisomal membrane peroxin-domain-containing protein [Xylariaceae sp. FL0804]|nr:integral peroxisomal membrane peroxin-domain-containing protein [Xylariaceae sp. FL0804]